MQTPELLSFKIHSYLFSIFEGMNKGHVEARKQLGEVHGLFQTCVL